MADPWGIDDGYWDVSGMWRPASATTVDALRAAMGGGDTPAPPDPAPLWSVREGDARVLDGPCAVRLEDGTDLGVVDRLPPDLPIGYHRLEPTDDGPTTQLIISPTRAHLPDEVRTWAIAVQLYAARSAASWGMGDLEDLRSLAKIGRELGAGLLAVNPLYDARTSPACEPSPYYPSTRTWLHPIYLRVDALPGAADLDPSAAGAAALDIANQDTSSPIDRDAVWAAKLPALRELWHRFCDAGGDRAFDRWRADAGDALDLHATFRAIADVHGADWREWPEPLRHPASPAVERWADDHGDDIGFWAWTQWHLHRQLADAVAHLPLLGDLPVGVDPGGADAWRYQDVLANEVRIGAPPDAFAPDGQNWGVAPFVPWKVRAAGYRPIVEMVRSACAASGNGGGLRIDHVMGLFRVFWVPLGWPANEGGYVRFPTTEVLDVFVIESVRAGTILVGEDLGTVEPEVREHLAERSVLSTRLVWFEDDPPARFPHRAMAAVTTHDLPTLAGLWSGHDAEAAAAVGESVDPADLAAMRRRLAAAAGVAADDANAPVGADEVMVDVHRALGRCPAQLVSVALDDLLLVEDRPNLPGTTEAVRPNWSIPLPRMIEDLDGDPRVREVAAVIEAGRRAAT